MAERNAVVYWLFNADCSDPKRDGYVGCTTDLKNRIKSHRNDKRRGQGSINVPPDFKHQILFRGPLAECLAVETQFRPTQDIGWNQGRGGRQGWIGGVIGGVLTEAERKRRSERMKRRKGYKHKPESIEKMSAAVKERYADPTVPRPIADYWKGKDRSGPNNPRFGAEVSETTKAKIGKANEKTICKRGHPREPRSGPCPECRRLRYKNL